MTFGRVGLKQQIWMCDTRHLVFLYRIGQPASLSEGYPAG